MRTANISIILSTICHQPKDLIYKSKPSKEVPCNGSETNVSNKRSTSNDLLKQMNNSTDPLGSASAYLPPIRSNTWAGKPWHDLNVWVYDHHQQRHIPARDAYRQSAEKHTLLNCSSNVVNQGLCLRMHSKVIWTRLQGSTIQTLHGRSPDSSAHCFIFTVSHISL